jgi:1,4-alpha-glucan branching enzyme
VRHDVTLLTDEDLRLFREGRHDRLHEKLGARLMVAGGAEGASFAVFAPGAAAVFVMGGFSGWDPFSHPLHPRGASGIWEGFLPGAVQGTAYKYRIVSRDGSLHLDKADPFALFAETAPGTASIVHDLRFEWGDREWMEARRKRHVTHGPVIIYEMHPGSWRRIPEEGNRPLTYRELAPRLVDHLRRMNFTHVEFLPLMEHADDGSWGYRPTGWFAPTSRYGTPEDFMFLVDTLHRNGFGVILDWVPSRLGREDHGLARFDGAPLFERDGPLREGVPEDGAAAFALDRPEVQSFLLSSARFWLEVYHADGLRIGAVTAMLHPDIALKEDRPAAVAPGTREDEGAIAFLKRLHERLYGEHPDIVTVAEETSTRPLVARPTYVGGLGFGMTWNTGWAREVLDYLACDPIHRKYHHLSLAARLSLSASENFVLPLAHGLAASGKGSLLVRMPGDDWQKFANLRVLFGLMCALPGKKLVFMGQELGPWREWDPGGSLDWHLAEHPRHAGLARWVEELNRFYRDEPALHERDFDPAGFEWIDFRDADRSVYAFVRKGRSVDDIILAVCNFTPVPRHNYRVGVPREGFWKECLNGDAREYGGSGQGNMGGAEAAPVAVHGRPFSLNLVLPPLSVVLFKSVGESGVS